MPYFQYSATDSTGKTMQGAIQANTAGEAIQTLMSRGLRSPRILAERAMPTASPPVAQPRQSAPQIRQDAPMPPVGPVRINVPAAASQQVHHSHKSSDKDLFFLFAQIAEQLRAGLGPVQTFSELAKLYRDPKFHNSLSMVAAAASEGRPISDALEQWPDLYPDHVVGLVRAGEMGGFLPEAAATISEQAGNAHKFKRFHWWVWVVAINALLSIPFVFMFRHALLTFADQSEAGTAPTGLFAVFIVMRQKLVWPWGPIILLLCGLAWWLRNFLSTRRMKRFRHEVGMKMPVLGARARNESVTIFSWVLSKLSKGGVPPNRSWELAVQSVPNLAMQDKLRVAGSYMNEGSKLSDIVFKSELFPQEYAPVVATGELTGDISGALERLSQASRTEYDASTVKSKAFTGTMGCTALIITTGIVTIVITWVWYREIYGRFINQANGTTTSSPAGTSGDTSPDD